MGKEYKQLSTEERCTVAAGLAQGLSRRATAHLLKRPHCAVIREINRNATAVVYGPHEAHQRWAKPKKYPVRKLTVRPRLWTKAQSPKPDV